MLPARVESVVFLGFFFRVELHAGTPFVALLSRQECLRLGLTAGDRVVAYVDPNHLLLVPKGPDTSSAIRGLNHQVGNVHLLFAEGADKGGDHVRIKIVAGAALQNFACLVRGAPLAIWAIAGDRIVGVGHGEDAGFEGNLLPCTVAVAGAIEAVVMRQDDGQHPAQ